MDSQNSSKDNKDENPIWHNSLDQIEQPDLVLQHESMNNKELKDNEN